MKNNLKFNGDNIDVDKLPIPTGWRILVGMVQVEEKTAGGILLPEEHKKHKENNVAVVKVLAMGALAYSKADFKDVGAHPDTPIKRWVSVGDIAIVGKYSGQAINCRDNDGKEVKLKLLNDDEILSLVPDLSDIVI